MRSVFGNGKQYQNFANPLMPGGNKKYVLSMCDIFVTTRH